jgi:DNA helicase-2/ATP-dependent DNA helicase PcrA
MDDEDEDREDQVPETVFLMKPSPKKDKSRVNLEKDLNEEQLQAVLHGEGPAIIVAGAGSGKTRALTYRVAYLVEQGVNPRNIMLVTFTKKAAEEMITRVQSLLGIGRGKIIAGTFHSIANQFLRRNARQLGFEPNFSIIDESDAEQLMKKILGGIMAEKGDDDKKRYPRPAELKEMYSKAMNLHLQVREVLANFYPQYDDMEDTVQTALQRYFDTKKKNNVMDFDDLLVYFIRLLRTDGLKEKVFKQVRHLLVDEYQDVNQLQADIVYELANRAESTVVVGDDAQSIYSWRGADVRHMLEFESLFEVPVAKYFLTINYRSTPQILALANASIKYNKKQFPKDLKATNPDGQLPAVVPCLDDDEEVDFICQSILKARNDGTPLHEQAVLFRTSYQSLPLERALLSYKIPYNKRAGLRFYETAHVKDLMSFALLVQNQRNEIAWARILTLLPGLGSRSADAILAAILDASDPLVAFCQLNVATAFKGKRVQATSKQALSTLQALFKSTVLDPATGTILPDDKLPAPVTFLQPVLDFYEPFLREKYDNADDRYQELKEFLNITARYRSISTLVEEIAISETFTGETTKDADDREEKPLVISTIHQAKGLEWDDVYIMGVADTLLPHARSMGEPDEIEEERRLFYVAATRPRKRLFLSYPTSKYSFQKSVILRRSSFLDEIEKAKVFQITRLAQYSPVTRFEDLLR